MSGSLLILGASVRAAAQSAARAGMHPICGDLFFDADLPAAARGQVAASFPDDLLHIAEQAPAAPWMYTGGLENHPRLVARISRDRELLGTRPESLRRVRDPFEVERILVQAGLLFPECRPTSDGLPQNGTWLRKSDASSGGLRVIPWCGRPNRPARRGWYFQRRVDGLPMSAVYLAAAGQSRLLGATQQVLVGSGPLPLQYAGSIGPVNLTPSQHASVSAVGAVVAGGFDLRGIFGVDFVLLGDQVWTIEINPRYTASTEVLERTLGFNAVALHVAACREARLPEPVAPASARLCGKQIVYGERSRIVDAEMVRALCERNRGRVWPQVADIPRAGTVSQPGHPVVTVFADGDSPAPVRARLRAIADDLRREFSI
ncbi:MAG TPA: ATP-grasp domain-containing protein [Pirellulales bacterium]|nr:ATP-grasp domain-containing protein [Pirellulales bacterium]